MGRLSASQIEGHRSSISRCAGSGTNKGASVTSPFTTQVDPARIAVRHVSDYTAALALFH
ncbi:hypothetical protein CAter282_3285 [Collimonas arenae]|uniref:Uncharacterized protein n=1 Tax=Collimonas arenae TaxID=279058 RepID=A0A127QMY7_9BURK|nr:hypothetical protein CAter10_3599 [Collimonas arenae]AMP10982.1 hypothetical protein CAter282_3285 [Collimonas arenae]